jgi:hypothetical protein
MPDKISLSDVLIRDACKAATNVVKFRRYSPRIASRERDTALTRHDALRENLDQTRIHDALFAFEAHSVREARAHRRERDARAARGRRRS